MFATTYRIRLRNDRKISPWKRSQKTKGPTETKVFPGHTVCVTMWKISNGYTYVTTRFRAWVEKRKRHQLRHNVHTFHRPALYQKRILPRKFKRSNSKGPFLKAHVALLTSALLTSWCPWSDSPNFCETRERYFAPVYYIPYCVNFPRGIDIFCETRSTIWICQTRVTDNCHNFMENWYYGTHSSFPER